MASPEPRRRAAPIVATALFVIVAVLAIVVVRCRHESGSEPVEASIPLAQRAIVPPVLGRQLADARTALRKAGLRADEDVRQSCDLVEHIADADPAPGTPVERGSSVRIRYDEPAPNVSCAYTPAERAWDLLDWAAGTGRQPTLAAPVEILGAGHPLSIDAADPPSAWPHLARIAHQAHALVRVGAHEAQPQLDADVVPCPDDASCVAQTAVRVELRLPTGPSPYAAFWLFLTGGDISGYSVIAAP